MTKKFGDIVAYPIKEVPDRDWLFMWIADQGRWTDVITLKVHPDDDQFAPGDILASGVCEFDVVDSAATIAPKPSRRSR